MIKCVTYKVMKLRLTRTAPTGVGGEDTKGVWFGVKWKSDGVFETDARKEGTAGGRI